MQIKKFVVDMGWEILLKDSGVDPADVLQRAQLPGDLFRRKNATLSTIEYFRFWKALEESIDDPTFPLRLGQSFSVETFSPPIFASLCSPNLQVAFKRLSQFKRLVGPMTLEVTDSAGETTVTLGCLDASHPLPASLVATELVFFLRLARLATRERIIPVSVTASVLLVEPDSYAEYFGVAPGPGKNNSITFSAFDTRRPFLTANEKMWQFFEPELRRRLSDVDAEASFAARVRSSLLELLPGGQGSIDDVAKMLAVSKRTLQRRLRAESTSFQLELNKTREQLAHHYLSRSELSCAQISFLLGFEDPNSFGRAFHSWTGTTPERLRADQSV